VVVVNKWDLVEERYTREAFVTYLDDALKGLSFAPVAFLTAKRGEGVRDLVAMALNLHQQAGHRVTTGELNRVMERIVTANPPRLKSGKRLKIYYVSQLEIHPPTIGLFVNQPEAFEPSYERYLLNRLRDELPYSEVPIRLVVRGRSRSEAEQGASPG
jgi:GTP-binding protein